VPLVMLAGETSSSGSEEDLVSADAGPPRDDAGERPGGDDCCWAQEREIERTFPAFWGFVCLMSTCVQVYVC
jgi:hypothetical protein